MNFRKIMRWSFFLWQGDRAQRYAYITPVRTTLRHSREGGNRGKRNKQKFLKFIRERYILKKVYGGVLVSTM